KKIIYANALLVGSATQRVLTSMDKVLAHPTNPTKWLWKSGNDFIDFLARKYANIDLVVEVEGKLYPLKIEGKYSRWEDFITKYNYNHGGKGYNNNTGAGKPKNPNIMEVDGLRANHIAVPEKEYLNRFNNSLYFNYGQASYIAKDYTNPTWAGACSGRSRAQG